MKNDEKKEKWEFINYLYETCCEILELSFVPKPDKKKIEDNYEKLIQKRYFSKKDLNKQEIACTKEFKQLSVAKTILLIFEKKGYKEELLETEFYEKESSVLTQEEAKYYLGIFSDFNFLKWFLFPSQDFSIQCEKGFDLDKIKFEQDCEKQEKEIAKQLKEVLESEQKEEKDDIFSANYTNEFSEEKFKECCEILDLKLSPKPTPKPTNNQIIEAYLKKRSEIIYSNKTDEDDDGFEIISGIGGDDDDYEIKKINKAKEILLCFEKKRYFQEALEKEASSVLLKISSNSSSNSNSLGLQEANECERQTQQLKKEEELRQQTLKREQWKKRNEEISRLQRLLDFYDSDSSYLESVINIYYYDLINLISLSKKAEKDKTELDFCKLKITYSLSFLKVFLFKFNYILKEFSRVTEEIKEGGTFKELFIDFFNNEQTYKNIFSCANELEKKLEYLKTRLCEIDPEFFKEENQGVVSILPKGKMDFCFVDTLYDLNTNTKEKFVLLLKQGLKLCTSFYKKNELFSWWKIESFFLEKASENPKSFFYVFSYSSSELTTEQHPELENIIKRKWEEWKSKFRKSEDRDGWVKKLSIFSNILSEFIVNLKFELFKDFQLISNRETNNGKTDISWLDSYEVLGQPICGGATVDWEDNFKHDNELFFTKRKSLFLKMHYHRYVNKKKEDASINKQEIISENQEKLPILEKKWNLFALIGIAIAITLLTLLIAYLIYKQLFIRKNTKKR